MDYSLLSRSYDLRGIYGVDIDDDFFYRLGYAFAQVTQKKRIALGYDARLSSPALKTAFTLGATHAGATIIDIGLVSSDMLSFATCHYDDIEAGVMITASHNPREYNGMKSMNHAGEPYNLKKYGPAMVEIMEGMSGSSFEKELSTRNEETEDLVSETKIPPTPLYKGSIETRNVVEDWTDHILSFAGEGVDFSRYTIVADGGNGSAGAFMTRLADKAGFHLIPLFLDPDGNFPHHHPNPMHARNREDARQALLSAGANVAWIFDGDADRVILLDEHGEQINSSVISAVIAESLMSSEPDASYIGNAVASHNYHDLIVESGKSYLREKVGHVYIRERMMGDPHIVYAGEHSAHYFFRDNYYMDSGVMAAMVFLSVIARSGQSISTYISRYVRYVTLEETNFAVPDPHGSLQKLTDIYQSEKYDLLDGLTVEYDDGSWWNFRPSSNEPLLRLNMEARTQERFDTLYAEIMEHIRTFGTASDD